MPRIMQALPLLTALLTHCTSGTPASMEHVVSAPSIGLSERVVVGDQYQLDAGNVVNYGYASEDRCWPGQDCTVWLAGHRTSHGGVFRGVPRLAVGNEVSLQHDGSTAVYVVTGRAFVDMVDPPVDFLHGDLMIQTSWTNNQVLLVYADLASI